MEDIFLKFPHLGQEILKQLDNRLWRQKKMGDCYNVGWPNCSFNERLASKCISAFRKRKRLPTISKSAIP